MEDLIATADSEFEFVWEKVAEISNYVLTKEETDFALKKVISYNPQNKVIAQCNMELQNATEIITRYAKQLNEVASEETEKFNFWSRFGHCYFLLGDYANALACYQKAKSLSSDLGDVYYWFCSAVAFQYFHFYNESYKHYSKALTLEMPDHVKSDIMFRQGILFRKMRRYKESVQCLSSIIENPPKKITKYDILFQIAYSYQSNNDNDEAFSVYNQIHTQLPTNLEIFQQFMLFLSFQNNKEYLKYGINMLAKEPKKFIDDPKVKLATARILVALDNIEAAYTTYFQCLNYWSDNPIVWCGLSETYLINGQMNDADVALKRAILLNPYIEEAWINLAYIESQKEERNTVISLLSHGLMANPQSALIRQKMNEFTKGKNTLTRISFGKMPFFVQIADAEGEKRITDAIEIPSQSISEDNSLQNSINVLCSKRESMFV